MHFAPYFGVRQILEYDKKIGTFGGRMHIFFACKTAKKEGEKVRFSPFASPFRSSISPFFVKQMKTKWADFGQFC